MPIDLQYTVPKDGKYKGREFVSVLVPGTGWKGLSPEVIRCVLQHANELRVLVSKTDAEILATAKRQAAIKAAQQLYSNTGDFDLTNAASADAAQIAMSVPPVHVTDGIAQDDINKALMSGMSEIAKQLSELRSFTLAAK